MGFSRQEYWSGLPFPLSEGLPDPKIEPTLLMSLALTGRFFTTSTTLEACRTSWLVLILAIMKEAAIKIHLQIFVYTCIQPIWMNIRNWTCVCFIGRWVLYHRTIRETVSPSTSCLSGPENSCSSWIKLFWMSFPPRYLTRGKQEPRLQITNNLPNTV